MLEDEGINSYVQRVDEMVSKMCGFGVEIYEPKIVKKILRTLPNAYNEKIFFIEEFIE
jgi:hypothetical protein